MKRLSILTFEDKISLYKIQKPLIITNKEDINSVVLSKTQRKTTIFYFDDLDKKVAKQQMKTFIAQEKLERTMEDDLTDKEWTAFKIDSALGLEVTEVLRFVLTPLADDNISVLVRPTYGANYIFVKSNTAEKAKACLRRTNFNVQDSQRSFFVDNGSILPSFAHINKLKMPIRKFSIHEFGLDDNALSRMKSHFANLPVDNYDARLKQIGILQSHISYLDPTHISDLDSTILQDYYIGIKPVDLSQHLSNLSSQARSDFSNVRPWRQRSMSTFEAKNRDNKLVFQRVRNKPFEQEGSDIASDQIDFRKLPRQFFETSERVTDTPDFKSLLSGVSEPIRQAHPDIEHFDVIAHHSFVQAFPGKVGSNAPEGIHQDGSDYIVSALVVNRENITGGVSKIYASDKKNVIFGTLLRPGYGIRQTDAGSGLWHTVTPVSVINPNELSYRSSIGFDINLGTSRVVESEKTLGRGKHLHSIRSIFFSVDTKSSHKSNYCPSLLGRTRVIPEGNVTRSFAMQNKQLSRSSALFFTVPKLTVNPTLRSCSRIALRLLK